jgi:hypothetical protein
MVSIFRRSEQKIRQPVGHDSVNLFWHASIKRTKPSFDVTDTYEQLCANQGGSYRGIDIPVNNDDVWLAFQQNRLETAHYIRRLPGMAARADFQVHVWCWDSKLREEHI